MLSLSTEFSAVPPLPFIDYNGPQVCKLFIFFCSHANTRVFSAQRLIEGHIIGFDDGK